MNLQTLQLRSPAGRVTDKGLRNLVNLTTSNLRGVNYCISDAGLVGLTKLATLELLDVETTNVTDNGISRLVSLTSLTANSTLTDYGISTLTNLSKLNILRNRNLSNTGIVGLTLLTSLIMGSNVQITDDGIKGLTNLTILWICSKTISLTCSGVVGKFPKLVELDGIENLGLSRFDVPALFREMPSLLRVLCMEVNCFYRAHVFAS